MALVAGANTSRSLLGGGRAGTEKCLPVGFGPTCGLPPGTSGFLVATSGLTPGCGFVTSDDLGLSPGIGGLTAAAGLSSALEKEGLSGSCGRGSTSEDVRELRRATTGGGRDTLMPCSLCDDVCESPRLGPRAFASRCEARAAADTAPSVRVRRRSTALVSASMSAAELGRAEAVGRRGCWPLLPPDPGAVGLDPSRGCHEVPGDKVPSDCRVFHAAEMAEAAPASSSCFCRSWMEELDMEGTTLLVSLRSPVGLLPPPPPRKRAAARARSRLCRLGGTAGRGLRVRRPLPPCLSLLSCLRLPVLP